MKGKSRVLKILALMLFLVGGYILIQVLVYKEEKLSVVAGLGPMIMSMALLIISKNVDSKK